MLPYLQHHDCCLGFIASKYRKFRNIEEAAVRQKAHQLSAITSQLSYIFRGAQAFLTTVKKWEILLFSGADMLGALFTF